MPQGTVPLVSVEGSAYDCGTYYPQGICRHWIEGQPDAETVAAAVAEPVAGRLHVVRGQPCSSWPVTYTC